MAENPRKGQKRRLPGNNHGISPNNGLSPNHSLSPNRGLSPNHVPSQNQLLSPNHGLTSPSHGLTTSKFGFSNASRGASSSTSTMKNCSGMVSGSWPDPGSKGCSSSTHDALRKGPAKPKPVFFWSNADVIKWLRRCCQEYHSLYAPNFFDHDITGRTLVRITDITLEKMGITDEKHREELCTEIIKLKLKSDIVELKDLEKKGPDYSTTTTN